MSKVHVAAWMIPIESGLNKKHILKILSLLPEESELVPFEIHEDNSSAYGFATTEIIDEENGLGEILELLGPVVDDWEIDSSEYIYTFPSGKEIYMGCDFRTVIFRSSEE